MADKASLRNCPNNCPKRAELAKIKRGAHVKVAVPSERFWVRVTYKKGKTIRGVVDNKTVFSKRHGYKYKDRITLEIREVWRVLEPKAKR
jgi:hypothetical protein